MDQPAETENNSEASNVHLFDEVQLLLAEKRTSLSTLRTGIAIFALPISTFSVLVATSHYYDPVKVWALLAALMVLNAGLIALGAYLIYRALKKIHRFDRLIRQIKLEHSAIARYLE